MFKNYFKTAWRNLLNRKAFSLINILGLAVSITCCMLICSYLYRQLTYDTYPEQAKNIYRVELHNTDNNATVVYPAVDVAVGKGLQDAFPEIIESARLAQFSGYFMNYNGKQFKEEDGVALADSNFLNLFSIPFLKGDSKTALAEPNSIVITKAFAKKYFGDDDPMGKQLTYGPLEGSLKVTGLIDKIPDNSHFHFDAFISAVSSKYMMSNSWTNIGDFTYVLLNKNADAIKLQSKFPQVVAQHILPEMQRDMGISAEQAKKYQSTFIFKLRPLTDIHLYSHTKYEMEPPGDIQYVYIFAALAVFILLLACVNFVNLATAASAKRSKEVGIRKVMGSLKKQLIFQFLAESVLISFLALAISLLLIYIMLPWFNSVSGEHITYGIFFNPVAIVAMIVFTVLTGIIAGIYPAFFLSGFNTIKVLKGSGGSGAGSKSFLRNGLVVFQFAVSLILIIATLVVYKQLNYMQHKKLGYNKEQVAVINDSYLLKNDGNAFKQELLRDSRIAGVSNAYGVPANARMNGTQVYPEEKKTAQNHGEIHINIYNVDYDYVNVLGMQMATGRNFSKDFPADSIDGVLINQSAAKDLGWNDSSAIGKKIMRSGQKTYTVVGVVKDFQYATAKDKIAPLMMLLRGGNSYLVKIKTADIPGVLAFMRNTWNSFSPDGPFEYTFLDDNFNTLYNSEQKTGQIFSVFSIVAIFIASLGLLGLISYTAERRTKEIGVRKVLGSSVQNIIILLTKDFVALIFIATLIAIPVAWWAMNNWLKSYAYRINIGWKEFAFAVILLLVIALLTVSYRAIKAALANPVESLRSE